MAGVNRSFVYNILCGRSMRPGIDRLAEVARAPNPPGIFVLDDRMGLVAKRPGNVPNSGPPAVRVISDNGFFSSCERSAGEIHIIGRIRWFAREM